jgi:hypothetical protein
MASLHNKEFAVTLLGDDPLDVAIAWIQDTLLPEDVFSDAALEDWALNNGYELTE